MSNINLKNTLHSRFHWAITYTLRCILPKARYTQYMMIVLAFFHHTDFDVFSLADSVMPPYFARKNVLTISYLLGARVS